MCDSCGTGTVATRAATGDSADAREFAVRGMSCLRGATKVEIAVWAVPGITHARIDLSPGRVAVAGTAADDAVRRAIRDAGYTVTGP
jgi:copper chaperone CopZ